MTHSTQHSDDIGLGAIFEATHETLTTLLQLPAGSHVDAAWTPFDRPGVLLLRVRGAGWPQKAGWQLPLVRAEIVRNDVGLVSVKWSVPEQTS